MTQNDTTRYRKQLKRDTYINRAFATHSSGRNNEWLWSRPCGCVADACVCVCHCVIEPLYLMRVFVFVREPLKDEKAEDEKAALKDEIRKEEAGRENPQVRTRACISYNNKLSYNITSQHENYCWTLSCWINIFVTSESVFCLVASCRMHLALFSCRPEEACEMHAKACHQAKYRLWGNKNINNRPSIALKSSRTQAQKRNKTKPLIISKSKGHHQFKGPLTIWSEINFEKDTFWDFYGRF